MDRRKQVELSATTHRRLLKVAKENGLIIKSLVDKMINKYLDDLEREENDNSN